jgi:NADH-quinone oxidoreductase subunit G
VPVGANGRGLREAGAIPGFGPGYAPLSGAGAGRWVAQIGDAAANGAITALYLFETDPVRDRPDRELWDRALHHAGLVVAHASILTEGIAEHAHVIFPAESSAEKDGTVVHPDGRLQRLRTAIAHPGDVRSGWWILAEIAKLCGTDLGVMTSPMAFAQLVDAVPFYEGITLDAIGGRGVRWPEGPGAARFVAPAAPAASKSSNGPPPVAGELALGTYRPIWAAPEVEVSPALKFIAARQQVEMSPDDARRLSLADGAEAEVSQNGVSVRAHVAVRTGVSTGTAFLAEGIGADSANVFTARSVTVGKPAEPEPKLEPAAAAAGAFNVQPPGEVPDELPSTPEGGE